MRKPFSRQGRLDCKSPENVTLNFECRYEIIPILRGLQHIYSRPSLRDEILKLVARDVNRETRDDCGRPGMDYWQILVLSAVRLGCNLKYDALQDLAEQHRALRQMMQLGDWEEEGFQFRRIRDNICEVRTETIEAIDNLIVSEGHRLVPEAVKRIRADSFVVDTNIHYPSESTLIRDGIRKVIELAVIQAEALDLLGWRQHEHLLRKVFKLSRQIERIAARKGPNYEERLKKPYRQLLKISGKILCKARCLCEELDALDAGEALVFQVQELRTFMERTQHVRQTARRRVLNGEKVPNEDKLFSIFEPHTQLYKRGKAGQPKQFGRLFLVYEDAAGFVVHHHLLPRDKADRDVIVEQSRVLQDRLNGKMESLSLDRGFHTPENQVKLLQIVKHPCLPKPGAKQAARQEATATVQFRQARQRHSGVESAIGALQAGNGLKRCRDHTEIGFERYLSLGILGRNLHTLGRLLIAQDAPESQAAQTQRKAA
ncbi:MAG: ISNCY family transposase [Deltaproteobacteria bacterium]|nr:MAG: ISNCY family transposase [Deltaproteobacteria bacterium]